MQTAVGRRIVAKPLILDNVVSSYETAETTAQRKLTAPLLAAVAIVLAAAAVLWARMLGDVALKGTALVAMSSTVALIFWQPLVGLCLMVFLVPVEQLYALAGGWVAITKIIGIVTFVSLLLKAQLRHSLVRFDPQSKWMLLFAVWVAMSLLWTKDKESAPFTAMTMAQLALFWVLIRAIITTREEVLALSLFFIAGTVLAIFVSAVFPRWGLAPRLIFGTANPNHLGRDIVVSLLLLQYFAPSAGSLTKIGGVLAGGTLMLGLVLTQSRASWVAFAACLPVALWRQHRITSILVTAAMGFVGFLMFSMQVLSSHLGVAPDELEYRGQTIVDPMTIRSSRLDIWRAGILLGTRHPILGVGAGAFIENLGGILEEHRDLLVRRAIAPHNSFIGIFAELGVIGLLIFSGVLWNCAKSIAAQPGSLEKSAALALFLSAIIQMQFMDAHIHKTIWLSLALSQILPAIHRRSQPSDEAV